MRALGTTKGILILTAIILMLYTSQYIFPELPSTPPENEQAYEINKNGLPNEIYNELTNKQIINELINFLENFKSDSPLIKKENEETKVVTYSFDGTNGERFSRSYYPDGSKASYAHLKPSEKIFNAVSFYETGELMRRSLQSDDGKINVLFDKTGSVVEIKNQNYY